MDYTSKEYRTIQYTDSSTERFQSPFEVLGDIFRSQFESHKINTVELFDCDPNGTYVQAVLITLQGSAENGSVDRNGKVYDFCSRFFCPWLGVPEDPVTGSAHCALGPYWAGKLSKTELYGEFLSEL